MLMKKPVKKKYFAGGVLSTFLDFAIKDMARARQENLQNKQGYDAMREVDVDLNPYQVAGGGYLPMGFHPDPSMEDHTSVRNPELGLHIPYDQSEYKKGGWIQKATASIKRRGTEGVCTGSKYGSSSCPPGSKRYNLAKTFRKMARNRQYGGSIDEGMTPASKMIETGLMEDNNLMGLFDHYTLENALEDQDSGQVIDMTSKDYRKDRRQLRRERRRSYFGKQDLVGSERENRGYREMGGNLIDQLDQLAYGREYPEGGYMNEMSYEDAFSFTGNDHENGGIPVSEQGIPTDEPHAEIEDGEVIVNFVDSEGKPRKYVFSKRLRV